MVGPEAHGWLRIVQIQCAALRGKVLRKSLSDFVRGRISRLILIEDKTLYSVYRGLDMNFRFVEISRKLVDIASLGSSAL
jgi:hypothetical protein